MSRIEFTSPDQVPLPPDKVEILDLQAEPYPDGKRVNITITFTPFQSYPSAEIVVLGPTGEPAASLDIIETIDTVTEITIHLPGKPPPGEYAVELKAFYLEEKISEQDPDRVLGLQQNRIGEATTHFQLS
jgi:hypothetical protein